MPAAKKPAADESAAEKQQFIEVGLSDLAEKKLEELSDIQARIDTGKAEADKYATLAAEVEAAKQEVLDLNEDLKRREVAVLKQSADNDKALASLESIVTANEKKEVDLSRREQHNKAREKDLDAREKSVASRESDIQADARAVAEVRVKNQEAARILADREARLEERKAKLIATEKAITGQP